MKKLIKRAAFLAVVLAVALMSVSLVACGKKLTAIEVTEAPAKVEYIEGQTFDPTGMVVTAVYGKDRETITDFDYEPKGALKTTDTVITISYKDKTVTQSITVAEKTMTDVSITAQPQKTAYVAGEKFDRTGMTVTATYNDGSTEEITDYKIKPSRELCANDRAVVVIYGEDRLSVPVEVEKDPATAAFSPLPVGNAVGAAELAEQSGNILFTFYNDYTVRGILDAGDATLTNMLANYISFPGTWERNDGEFTLVLNSFVFDPQVFAGLAGMVPDDMKEMFDMLLSMDPIDITGCTCDVTVGEENAISFVAEIKAMGFTLPVEGEGVVAPEKIRIAAGEKAEAEIGDYSRMIAYPASISILKQNDKWSNGYVLQYCGSTVGNVWKMTVNSETAVSGATIALGLQAYKYKTTYTLGDYVTVKVNGTEISEYPDIALDKNELREFSFTADLAAGDNTVEIAWKEPPVNNSGAAQKITNFQFDYLTFSADELLGSGGKTEVSATVQKEDLRAYDAKTAKTYVLDDGDYYFAFGTDAHDALNNVLAAKGKTVADGMTAPGNAAFVKKWTNKTRDVETYSKDGVTGGDITNRFDDAMLTYYGLEHNILSRSDWDATYPETYASLTPTDAMKTALKDEYSTDASITEMPTTGKPVTKTLVDARGLPYDHEVWTAILDSLTWDEMAKLAGTAGYQTAGIPKIDKGNCLDYDGPAGLSGELYGGKSGVGFPAGIVLASTWNAELVRRMGEMVGEDGLDLGVTGWYAPAVNIHRNAFAGRNFEYYSENPCLTGKLAAAEITGAQSKGMYVYVKHFALNDQETNRIGVATFACEQAIRELYLEAFEIAVQEGNAHGIMSSFNRIGCQWAGASHALLTEVLRGEWGFDGHVVTDASMMSSGYMRIANGLKAGNDCWLSTSEVYVGQIDQY